MTSSVFNGNVMVPGESGRGLSASLSFAAGDVTLTTESDVLGTWSAGEYDVQPTDGGEFRLTLGGEDLLFRPEAPAEFATAVLPEGTPIPLSEEDAHHERWDEPEVPESIDAEQLPHLGDIADEQPEMVEEPPEATPAKKAKQQAPAAATWPVVESDLGKGLDDGIITAGFLRAIVVVSAALITFAIVAILLV